MKYKIEKNTVQETLVIPLYGRKMCSRLYPSLYRDETAIQLIDQLDYDFSVLEKKSGSLMQRFGFLECAMRQNDLAFEVRDYLKTHPNAAVVNLGCGLDGTGRACDNGSCKIYNLDFPEVIRVRDELLPAAIDVVMETGQASVSMLQRRLKLGYSRAARIVDEMETRGIVGPFEGSKPRQLLITKEQWQELKMKGAYGAVPPEAEELPPPDEEN